MNSILCIETSGLICSVALSQNGDCKAFKSISDEQYRHAEVLHTLIQEVLAEANVTLNSLKAIAISKGPGSYTGLRVGVSSAKGFCYGLGIPLIAINTLYLIGVDALTKHSGELPAAIIPMIDARRDEVYLQEFDQHLHLITNPQPVILSDYHPDFDSILFCGDGCEKSKVNFTNSKHAFIPKAGALASNMCKIAYELFEKKAFEDVAYFEPFYLKEFYSGKK